MWFISAQFAEADELRLESYYKRRHWGISSCKFCTINVYLDELVRLSDSSVTLGRVIAVHSVGGFVLSFEHSLRCAVAAI